MGVRKDRAKELRSGFDERSLIHRYEGCEGREHDMLFGEVLIGNKEENVEGILYEYARLMYDSSSGYGSEISFPES